ncbi:MAG TPA: hypothetical protein VMD47_10940 [Candidatus Acidoferrales bacterium]|nr:hypothetical protein [Candidatus Acidoferrales bacterium]HTX57601.1 hypothetical protein [Candidatus Acidoferrales bacterium]
MTWEAIGAFGSILAAVVLAVASFAALLQLKHLRLASQLESYAHCVNELQSAEITEARAFLETLDASDPAALEAAITPHVDHRIAILGAHFQSICRLLNLGVLDERLFVVYVSILPSIWSKLKPIAYALREREDAPRWIDIEYLVYRSRARKPLLAMRRDYDPLFLRETCLGAMLERNQSRIDEL